MKVCVLGLGYIGLPTALFLALSDHDVVGFDINKNIVDDLNNKKVNIKEPELDKIVNKLIDEKKLIGKTTPEKADAFIICVPTPLNLDKTCNLDFVLTALDSIIPYLEKDNLVIVESTIPPGTIKYFIKPKIEQKGYIVGENIYLCYCPERVIPGNIAIEIVENNRIIGGATIACAEKAATLYKSFVKGEISITDTETAEMTKLVENIYRDMNIALSNELTIICNELNINPLKVIKLANKHPRVNLLNPGPGVGGHCLPIDPYFVIEKAPESSNMISISRKINENMPHYIVSKIKSLVNNFENPKIAIWGITYKGNTDDARNSPAIDIIRILSKEGYEISIYDPSVDKSEFQIVSKEETLEDSDLLLILAEHNKFKNYDYISISRKMRNPIIFDTRNILDVNDYTDTNIKLFNLGNIDYLS